MIGFVDPYQFTNVPVGVIIPWASGAHIPPTGWTFFTAPNPGVGGFSGCYIRAAGGTVGVNTTGIGGTPAGHVRFDSQPDGTHLGTGGAANQAEAYTQDVQCPAHNPSWRLEGGEESGNHTHTLDATPVMGYTQFQFIRASVQVEKFPINGVLLNTTHSASSLQSIYTQIASTGKYLRAADRYSSAETSCPTTMDNTLDNGKHRHYWWPAYWALGPGGTNSQNIFYSSVGPNWDGWTGYHLHTINSVSLVDNIKKIYTTAWTNQTTEFTGFRGMLAFWDGITPATCPDGWSLCDGSNGTIDMREYFIMMGGITETTPLGFKTGTNQINVVPASGNMLATQNFTNLPGGQGHRHTENEYVDISGGYRLTSAWHMPFDVNHWHGSTQGLSLSYYPQYYGLYVIQKL
jgi:hypothetical protein